MDTVADTKKFLNPDGNPKWTNSDFKFFHGNLFIYFLGNCLILYIYIYFFFVCVCVGIKINKRLHFRIDKDSLGDVRIQSKSSAQDTCWSQAYYPLKRTPTVDLTKFPSSAIKVSSEKEYDMIKKGVASCQDRMDPEEYEEVLYELDKVINVKSKPFHWKDNGLFRRQILEREYQDVVCHLFICLLNFILCVCLFA